MSDKVNIVENAIGCLPTINAPATNLGTMQEVCAPEAKLKCYLGLESMVAVIDQPFCAKAMKIM